MALSIPTILTRALKYLGIGILVVLLSLVLLPYLFPDFVTSKVKSWANKSIDAHLDFSRPRLSFFSHFPTLTLTLHDFSMTGSSPFEKDTLLAADEIDLGINIAALLSRKVRIDKFFLSEGRIQVLVDEKGSPNYAVYHSSPTSPSKPSQESEDADIRIESIDIEHCSLIYDDRSIPVSIRAKGLNYSGDGDMSAAVFGLTSKLRIDSLDISHAGQPYILHKSLSADLITRVNTRALSLDLEKTDLEVNALPLQLNGLFSFLSKGYRMDLHLSSREAHLDELLTAFPPGMMPWVDKTRASGLLDLKADLKGDYVGDSANPDLHLKLALKDGMIAYEKSPTPLTRMMLDLQATLPGLDPERMTLHVDTLGFHAGEGHFASRLSMEGLSQPYVKGHVDANLDLGIWQRALGLSDVKVNGRLALQVQATGKFSRQEEYDKRRGRRETVITSIPAFQLNSTLRQGSFQVKPMKNPVEGIWLDMKASCADDQYKHIALTVDSLSAAALGNKVSGHLRVEDMGRKPIDADLHTMVHLADIDKFYPLPDFKLAGDLDIAVRARGPYLPEKKRYPVTRVALDLVNGSILTRYYPKPIEQIQLDATVTTSTPDPRSADINLRPVSFVFEGKSFLLKADVKDLEDIRYDMSSNGTVDLGKISQVFSLEEYGLHGIIETNLVMRGSKKDAEAGRYDQLYNKGTLRVKDIELHAPGFPKPFEVREGAFHFEQDDMLFDRFKAAYGSSDLELHGRLEHLISYVTHAELPLEGRFQLISNRIVVDEFTAYAPAKPASGTTPKKTGPAGVVLIPEKVDLALEATVAKVRYQGLEMNEFKGQVSLDSGRMNLRDVHFGVLGTSVTMDGAYESVSPTKAIFDYRVDARDFDVKKAYQEVDLFHDLVPSAANAEGIVSLNYHLSGKLNASMDPVMPSLKGEGVLSLKKVKLKGFKMMNSLSNTTGRDAIKDPDLSKVDIHSRIANNIMTIERFKMKIAGFRPRFEGQIGLDGKLNLKGRLGLPPFGIFGIPFTVTGTQKDPKVGVRRARNSDQLEETKEEAEE